MYSDVDPPDDKPFDEYEPPERRAVLFDLVIEKGHPRLLNQTELAEQFDVDQSRISRDLDTIADEVADQLGNDAQLVTKAIYERAIREMAEDEEWGAAISFVESWNEYLFDIGAQDRSAEKVEIDKHAVTHSTDGDSDALDDETAEQLDQLRDSARADVSADDVDGLADGGDS